MPVTKLTPHARRELTRRLLEGESAASLSSEYGVHWTWVHRLRQEALEDPLSKMRDAHAEFMFREWVLDNATSLSKNAARETTEEHFVENAGDRETE